MRPKKTGHHFSSHRLEHLDRRDPGEALGYGPVVLEPDIDLALESGLLDLALRPGVLLLGERDAGDLAAGLLGGMDREPAPAAADLEQVVFGRGLQQLEHAVPLAHLRIGEALAVAGEHRRGVRHGLVEPQLVEVVAEVVVVRDVLAAARLVVVAKLVPDLGHGVEQRGLARLGVEVREPQVQDGVQVGRVPVAVHVALGEADRVA